MKFDQHWSYPVRFCLDGRSCVGLLAVEERGEEDIGRQLGG